MQNASYSLFKNAWATAQRKASRLVKRISLRWPLAHVIRFHRPLLEGCWPRSYIPCHICALVSQICRRVPRRILQHVALFICSSRVRKIGEGLGLRNNWDIHCKRASIGKTGNLLTTTASTRHSLEAPEQQQLMEHCRRWRMQSQGKLQPQQIATIREWIQANLFKCSMSF